MGFDDRAGRSGTELRNARFGRSHEVAGSRHVAPVEGSPASLAELLGCPAREFEAVIEGHADEPGTDAENLRKQMDETRKGLIEQPDWAVGWLKAMSSAAATGWQSFVNGVGTTAAAIAERVSVLGGAAKGTVAGIKSLLGGGGISGFYEAFTQGIAEGMTAGDTAESRARVMTSEAQILERKAKRKDEKAAPGKLPSVTKGYDPGVSADALAQVGIFTARFGMNARTEKWQDEMLNATKQIASNTGNGSSGPPGPIAR